MYPERSEHKGWLTVSKIQSAEMIFQRITEGSVRRDTEVRNKKYLYSINDGINKETIIWKQQTKRMDNKRIVS